LRRRNRRAKAEAALQSWKKRSCAISKALLLKTAVCALQRLTHHCHIVETASECYRLQHSSIVAKTRIKKRE